MCLDVCVHAIRSSHSVGNLVGIEAKLLSIVTYWMWHVPSGSRYSERAIDCTMYLVYGDQETDHFFSMNSLRHLLWIMSDTTKAVAFGDRYYNVTKFRTSIQLVLLITCKFRYNCTISFLLPSVWSWQTESQVFFTFLKPVKSRPRAFPTTLSHNNCSLAGMPITHNVFHLQPRFSYWKQAINKWKSSLLDLIEHDR